MTNCLVVAHSSGVLGDIYDNYNLRIYTKASAGTEAMVARNVIKN